MANVDPASRTVHRRGRQACGLPPIRGPDPVQLGTGKVIKRIDPNASPSALVSGYGALWLTDSQAGNVIRIDGTGLRTAIPVGNGPTGIAAGAGAVWVADMGDDKLVRIDPQTPRPRSTSPLASSGGVTVGGRLGLGCQQR